MRPVTTRWNTRASHRATSHHAARILRDAEDVLGTFRPSPRLSRAVRDCVERQRHSTAPASRGTRIGAPARRVTAGDEIFGGNDRMPSNSCSSVRSFPAALRKGPAEPIVCALRRIITRAFPIGKAASYIEQANVPLPDRLQTYNFLHGTSPSEMFSHELAGRASTQSTSRAHSERICTRLRLDPINRHAVSWTGSSPCIDNDLVKVNTMCELAGVEVAYPNARPAPSRISAGLCPATGRSGTVNCRWFYKRAMQGSFPTRLSTRLSTDLACHSACGPERTQVCSALPGLHSALGPTRILLKSEFLREASRLHRDGHASYYGRTRLDPDGARDCGCGRTSRTHAYSLIAKWPHLLSVAA